MQGRWWSVFSARLRNTAFDPAIIFDKTRPNCPCALISIDIRTQTLALVIDGTVADTYQVSTSKYGAGCRQDTGCTPTGWHIVAQKIGADETIGTVFKGRRAIGITEDLRSGKDDDLITSRILWLSGLQARFNQGGQVDSKNRYIYIHGTAQEHLLGEPVSEGCIRMANTNVIELFNRVDIGTAVFIGQESVL